MLSARIRLCFFFCRDGDGVRGYVNVQSCSATNLIVPHDTYKTKLITNASMSVLFVRAYIFREVNFMKTQHIFNRMRIE